MESNEVTTSTSTNINTIVDKANYYRNFVRSLGPETLATYVPKLRIYMHIHLGILPSSSSSPSSSSPRKKRKTKPSSFNVPDYAEEDYAKLIEGKSVNQIEDEIRNFIEWQKQHHYKRQSQTNYLAAICKFYSRNRVRLDRDWLSDAVSKEDVVAVKTDEDMDRLEKGKAYSQDQISQLLEFCKSLRTRVMILLMASTGMRLGALPLLRFGDLTPVPEHNLYQVRVYSNSTTSSQRYSFCTPECRKAIDNYLDNRRRDGERITRASPLLRAEYNARDPFDAANNVRPVSVPTVKRCISNVLYDSGLRTPLAIDASVSLNNRRGIPMDHGFRRFFFGHCRRAGMEKMDIDWCMGHKLGVDESYFQPDIEGGICLQILESHDKKVGYLDAIDFLTINKENRLKRENETLKVKKSEYEQLKEDLEQSKAAHDYNYELYQQVVSDLKQRDVRIAEVESKYDNLSKQYLIDIKENNNRAKISTEITRLEAVGYGKENDIVKQTSKQILELAEDKPTERSAIDALNLIKSMLTEINNTRTEMAQNINEKNEKLKKSIDRQTWLLD